MTVWRNIIHLWELPSTDSLPNMLGPDARRLRPGIHFAAKRIEPGAYQTLFDAVVQCVERGSIQGWVPAGLRNGVCQTATVVVTDTYTPEERRLLHDVGINPIILKGGTPYIWGQKYRTASGSHVMSEGSFRGLTPEFVSFITEMARVTRAVMPGGQCLPATKPAAIMTKPVAPEQPIHRALRARPGQYGLYMPGLR